ARKLADELARTAVSAARTENGVERVELPPVTDHIFQLVQLLKGQQRLLAASRHRPGHTLAGPMPVPIFVNIHGLKRAEIHRVRRRAPAAAKKVRVGDLQPKRRPASR